MSADGASLNALTDLLSEFYSPSIKPERRTAIQQVLLSFEQIPNSWHVSSYYLFSTSNPCVALYCLGVIEKVVVQRWSSLESNERLELRRLLQTYLFERATIDDPHYLIKKAAKILACIACFDWPHEFSTYMEDIKQYISKHLQPIDLARLSIGLFVLRVSVEQCLDPQDLVTHDRRVILRTLLVNESVSVYSVFLHIISHLCGSELLISTSMLLNAHKVSPVDPTQSTVWHSIFRLTESLSTALSNQSSHRCMAMLAWLECFNQVIRVFPIDTNFYSPLYVCSMLGSPAFVSACGVHNLPSNPTTYLTQIGLCALTCVQEIIERTDLGQDMIQNQLTYIFPLIQCHLDLLTGRLMIPYSNQITNVQLAKDPNADIASAVAVHVQTESNCSEYRSKLTDILKFLMTNFFCQLSGLFRSTTIARSDTAGFEPVRFLESLHDFTFSSPQLDNYISCLHIYTAFFEFVQMRYPDDQFVPLSSIVSSDLLSTFVTFGRTLLYRLFYSNAASFLETLDTDNEDLFYMQGDHEEQQTEIIFTLHTPPSTVSSTDLCESRLCLQESLLTMNTVMSLVPDEIVNLVLERYYNTWNDFVTFARNSEVLTSNQFNIPPKNQPLHHVHWLLRDYATSLQLVGFLFGHPKFTLLHVNDRTTGVGGGSESAFEFLNSLVYGLQISHHMMQYLTSINEPLIRSDLIGVIVQNVLILHALLLGNHLTCVGAGVGLDADNPRQRLTLNDDQAQSFIAEILVISNSILMQQSKDFLVVQSCVVRLFDALCICPFSSPYLVACLLPSSSSASNLDSKQPQQPIDRIRSTVYQLFDYLCVVPENRISLKPQSLRRLIRTLFRYLSADPHSHLTQIVNSTSSPKNQLMEIKHSKLTHLITTTFCPILNATQLSENPENHLTCLGFLNYALSGLHSLTGNSRRLVSTIFQESGIFNNLVDCISKALNSAPTDQASASMRLKFCTAYLTFFTNYIHLISQAGSSHTVNLQDLLVRLVKELMNTGTGAFPVPLHDCLVDIILSLSTNRRIFVPLVEDLLNLCHYHLLPSLCDSTPPKSNGVDWTKLMCEAAHANGSSVQKLCELLFAILLDGFNFFFNPRKSTQSNEMFHHELIKPHAFHQNLHILVSVFDSTQTNSDLVKFVLNQLQRLHFVRKLYNSPDFSQHWLPKIVCQLITLLLNKEHNSCRDELIECLHCLLLSTLIPSSLLQNGMKHPMYCDVYLPQVQQFISIYLDSQQSNLNPQYRSNLIAAFLSPISASNSTNQSTPIDMDTFKRCLEQFLIDLRHHLVQSVRVDLLSNSN